MKRLLLTFAVSLCFTGYAHAAETREAPDVKARGAVIMEMSTGRVLWERNMREPMPMASTTKIMTAVMALENGDLDDVVTVSANAASAPRVKMGLSVGEKIPLIDLLYALMLQSSNDAAVAIAEHIGGTEAEFCRLMTLKARETGVFDTSFQTPNGLDAPEHLSTAYDMAVITRYALRNEKFVEIINTMGYTAKSDRRVYDVVNKDLFLTMYDGAFGVKTGYTGGAGYCFVGAAERGGMRLITVALGSGWGAGGKERKWIDTRNMMNYAFNEFAMKEVGVPLEPPRVAVCRVKGTRELEIEVPSAGVFPLTESELGDIRCVVELPEVVAAPVVEGQFLGKARFYAGEVFLAERELVAPEFVGRQDLKTAVEATLNAFLSVGLERPVSVDLPELPEWLCKFFNGLFDKGGGMCE